MMKNKVILVRHGENIYDDTLPNNMLPLSNLGIKQAKWASEVLNNDFDLVFSSISRRTIETAKIISKNIKPIEDERLLEKGYGNKKHDGSETEEEATKRIKSFFKDIEEKYTNKKILIVTHGALMKLIEDLIENKKEKRSPINNCDIIIYENTNKKVMHFS